jgi:hypothetical protein
VITVSWRGKAVSENRRHVLRDGRLSASREYEAFVEELALAIMAEARRQAGVRIYESMSLIAQLSIGPRMDGQNLLKPICDAIQRSGVLANDRNLRHRALLPDQRHKQGEEDSIMLHLYELEGKGD